MKYLVPIFILFLNGIIFSSCSKIKTDDQNNNFSNLIVFEGRLKFKNHEEFSEMATKLAGMSFVEKTEFFSHFKGFNSLGCFYNELQRIENNRIETFFKGLDPNLTTKEYISMGYNYIPSTQYFNALKSGKIIESKDASGCRSFKPFVNNPGFLDLINLEGEVYVGNFKYSFEEDIINVYNEKNILVDVFNFSSSIKATSNWSQGGNWMYDGDTKRYYCKVYGSCITSSETTEPGIISSTFYVDALAENRRFGIWGSRSSYMPIYSFSGNWSSSYQARPCYLCTGQSNPFNLLDNDYSSPFVWSSVNDPNGQTNHFLRYFKPNGSWDLPDGWYVAAPFSVTYNMNFSISGGTSGYNYQLTL